MKLIPALIPTLFVLLFSCQSGSKESADYSTADSVSLLADSSAVAAFSSSAASENNKDPAHTFIRTADLKFKVQDVVRSTADIEQITVQQGGFVTFTNLASEKENVTTVPVSKDSALETTWFGVTNSMTLRVPNLRLDTTLKEIARTVDYLDFRVIKADDVALKILSNELTQKRLSHQNERLLNAIDTRRSKLPETTAAEEKAGGKLEDKDHAMLANLSMKDQIRYSTVTLHIYQRQGARKELVAIQKEIPAYIPPFGTRLVEAVQSGWTILLELLLFVIRLWPLLLAGSVAYYIFRSYKRTLVKVK